MKAGTVPCLDPFSGKRWARAFEFSVTAIFAGMHHCLRVPVSVDPRVPAVRWKVSVTHGRCRLCCDPHRV